MSKKMLNKNNNRSNPPDTSALQFGLMNSLRTGNPTLDMLACSVVPTIFSSANVLVARAQPTLERGIDYVMRMGRTEYRRTVRFEKIYKAWGTVDNKDERNNILQKAILMYLSQECGIKIGKSDAAEVLLMTAGTEKKSGSRWNPTYGSNAEQLKQYSIFTSAPKNNWVEIEEQLYFMISDRNQEEEEEREEGRQKETIDYEFRSSAIDGKARIDNFLKNAYEWYVRRVESQTDKARYLYVMQVTKAGGSDDGGDEDGPKGKSFKRYKLSGNKTFNSLFFPQKELLMRLITQFNHRDGKFAIPGYPHKLGLLLHGPPGTGKTSLIKALAHYCGRNVVNVPLGRVETNQELMDVVFDRRYDVLGEELPVRLDFSKVIFVMEDVDAACKVVLKRSKDKADEENEEENEEGLAKKADDMMMMMAKMMSAQSTGGIDLTGGGEAGASSSKKGGGLSADWLMPEKKTDKLDLSGVLNVLDGVVDCPNRILVMTSNHPEKLDPALIRPGRINLQLCLDYIQLPEAKQMVKHYFGDDGSGDNKMTLEGEEEEEKEDVKGDPTLTPMEEFEAAWKKLDRQFTPAQLEQLVAECDTLKELPTKLASL